MADLRWCQRSHRHDQGQIYRLISDQSSHFHHLCLPLLLLSLWILHLILHPHVACLPCTSPFPTANAYLSHSFTTSILQFSSSYLFAFAFFFCFFAACLLFECLRISTCVFSGSPVLVNEPFRSYLSIHLSTSSSLPTAGFWGLSFLVYIPSSVYKLFLKLPLPPLTLPRVSLC